MPVFALDEELLFPPVDLAEPDGLLAIGGDLSVERLLLAYRSGVFPWYEGEHILWWCPDPRFVLFPPELKVSKTMKRLIRKNVFDFTINKAFKEVIHECKKIKRPGQQGTWITPEMYAAYVEFHRLGYAHSAEAWHNGVLVGGIYGVDAGGAFAGESMFHLESNASKFALLHLVEHLAAHGLDWLDIQVMTPHLESFGARPIPRSEFLQRLSSARRLALNLPAHGV